MRVLLDTHIWLWWVHQAPELNREHQQLIDSAESIFVSAISCWEVAMLQQRNKIILSVDLMDWFQLAMEESGVESLSISQRIAILAAQLPMHHKDPADRLIIASALKESLYLLSYDSKFSLYDEIKMNLIQANSSEK